MKWGGQTVDSVGGMKLGKREDHEKTSKIPTLLTRVHPLTTPRLELGTPVVAEETNSLSARTVRRNSLSKYTGLKGNK